MEFSVSFAICNLLCLNLHSHSCDLKFFSSDITVPKEDSCTIGLPVYLIYLVTVCFCFHSYYPAAGKYGISLQLPVALHNDQPYQSAGLPFTTCHCYILPDNWVSAIACDISDIVKKLVCHFICFGFCILPLSLQLHVAVSTSALSGLAYCSTPKHLAGITDTGAWMFLQVRMIQWPLVHSPPSPQAPACLVDALGRWTVAQLPWCPLSC